METIIRFKISNFFICIAILFVSIYADFMMPNQSHAACTSLDWGSSNGWLTRDNDKHSGTVGASINGSRLTIDAYGDDVWTTSDQYYAYYRDNVTGDWEAQVRVSSQTNTNGWAKSGIMVKNDLTVSGEDTVTDSTRKYGYCMVAVTPSNGVTFQWDSTADGRLDSTVNTGGTPTFPIYLKLRKEGTTFSGWYSTDGGINWTQVGSNQIMSSAKTTQDLGVFVTSHSSSSNQTVFRNFCFNDLTSYTVTASAGANGSMASGGYTVTSINSPRIYTVAEGYNQTFTINPNTGYAVQQVLVDSVDVTASLVGNAYTFTNVTSSHTISVSFVLTTNIITASAGSGGSISPSGAVSVNYGSNQTFTVTPNSGYEVLALLVDGVNAALTGDTYTFTNVTSAHTIAVTFKSLTYVLTSTASSGGSISPSGALTVNYGDNQTYQVSVNTNYSVASFTVDGTPAALNASKQYTLTNITASHTINVTFSTESTVTVEVPGCEASASASYSSGFVATDFNLQNVSILSGKIVLQTGSQAIDPNSIIIPFRQDVYVSFLYEGAGYESDLGYILASDAILNANGTLNWGAISKDKKHMIFHNIHDETSDGVLDTNYGNGSFPNTSESALAAYNDGATGYPGMPFVPDGDGTVTTKDMRKKIGTFDAGTELIFFLTADKNWNDDSITNNTYYTKKDWNPDTYSACTPSGGGEYTDCTGTYHSSGFNSTNNSFYKKYQLGTAMSEGSCSMDKGWLDQAAITRMNTAYGVSLTGTANLCMRTGQRYPHVIVGAPPNDPNQWILGWEDLSGGGDCDHNDMVFRIERKTGGVAQLESTRAPAIAAGAYYTAVTFEVYDNMPCAGSTKINYWVSINNGTDWVQITNWDEIRQSSAAKTQGNLVTGWTFGTPQYTYRKVRLDFASLGMSGDKLIWKSQLESQNETCQPEILDVLLNGTVSTNGSFSRSSPTILANMSYSGSYETPAITWTDKAILRGHLRATRIYDPAIVNATSATEIWDAGAALNSMTVDSRKIFFPGISVYEVTEEILATGNGVATTFTGSLSHDHIVATTVDITNTVETFVDKHTDLLEGTLGGTGTINRYSGAYTFTFATAPADGVPIKARYSYYTTASALPEFTETNVTSGMLGLNNGYVEGKGFTYDLNNDGRFNGIAHDGTGTANDSDGDWLVEWVRGYKNGTSKTIKKEWLLGAIDHSVPAVESPPGMPKWYYGTDITEDERKSYSDFKTANKERDTVVYVGARDGMIHAFDAGKFRWGDNERTGNITENRGYFLWTGTGSETASYGAGNELWSFIPANLIPRLKNNLMQAEDQAYVDASPTLADVYINGAWRTILACAEGNGGDTVFCLDVTVPDDPKFLWEYSDPDLFRSRSSPTVGFGRMVIGGTPTWVALFVSGKSNDSTAYPSIYIINVETGALIERVYLDNSDYSERGRGGVPSGQPAIVDSDGNGFIDRLYIGTDKGFLYKVNLPDDPSNPTFQSITHCIINTDFSYTDQYNATQTLEESQQFHPVYASPTVTVNNTLLDTGDIQYKINIFFGTGDSPYYDEDINTGNTRYHFFAYNDGAAKGECNGSVGLSWFYTLPAGQRVWASAFASAGQIFFGTSTAETEDPCEAISPDKNAGQLFMFTTDGTPLKAFNTGNIVTSPVVEDEHIYFRTSDGLNSMGGNVYNNEKTKVGVGTSRIDSWEEVSQ